MPSRYESIDPNTTQYSTQTHLLGCRARSRACPRAHANARRFTSVVKARPKSLRGAQLQDRRHEFGVPSSDLSAHRLNRGLDRLEPGVQRRHLGGRGAAIFGPRFAPVVNAHGRTAASGAEGLHLVGHRSWMGRRGRHTSGTLPERRHGTLPPMRPSPVFSDVGPSEAGIDAATAQRPLLRHRRVGVAPRLGRRRDLMAFPLDGAAVRRAPEVPAWSPARARRPAGPRRR